MTPFTLIDHTEANPTARPVFVPAWRDDTGATTHDVGHAAAHYMRATYGCRADLCVDPSLADVWIARGSQRVGYTIGQPLDAAVADDE